MQVLVVEDEKRLAQALAQILKEEKYLVDVAYTGSDGLDYGLSGIYDVIVLDVMLPGLSGFEIAAQLRREKINSAILMLTARDAVPDRVAGLDSGADDYLTKPFAIEELLARMRVAFKHSEGSNIAKKTILQVQNLEIDTEKRMVTVDGKVVDLTKKEYELLTYLVQNKNIVLTREQILNEVWGYSYIGETNVVDVYIRYLRAKIDEAFGKKYILTIRGVGYYVKEE